MGRAVIARWMSLNLLFGVIEPILVRWAYGGAATAAQLICIKGLAAAAFALPFLKKPVPGKAAESTAAGLLLFATITLIYLGLQTVPASVAIIILSSVPATVAAAGSFFKNEKLTGGFWAGLVVCLIGAGLTAGGDFADSGSRLGIILLCASVATSTIYRIIIERLTRGGSTIGVSAFVLVLSGLSCAAAFSGQIGSPSGSAWVVGVLVGVLGAAANFTFLKAIGHGGATRASVLHLLQRPVAAAAAVVLLAEPLHGVQALGIALTFLGVFLSTNGIRAH